MVPPNLIVWTSLCFQIAAMAPDRTDTLRPVLGSRGGTDALAYSFGRSRVQLGVNMAATALPKNAPSDSALAWGQAKDVVLYFGIIDILQEWDVSKRVEHTYKSIKFRDSHSMSAVEPKTYSQRFQDYISSLFL
jgi:1-phosphatidylinositol-4-phosphate 5-kinase